MRETFIALLFSTALLMPSNLKAEHDLDALLSLDLDALSNVTVSVASKREEKISAAPSVVNVITAKEIEMFGARNLIDVLNRATSIQFTNSLLFANNTLSLRGQNVQHYSNRMLFLINGRPFRDSLTGGQNMPLFMGFPISQIEKIEIIRGPGSVLYGSNAFSGVVDIITKTPEIGESFSASTSYGSDQYFSTEFSATKAGKDWNMMGATKTQNSNDGWGMNIVDATNTAGVVRRDDSDHSFTGVLNYKNFTMNVFNGNVDQNGVLTSLPADKFINHHWFVDTGYEHEISDDWSANINATYNRVTFTDTGNSSRQYSNDIITELMLTGKLADNVNLLLGANYENQDGKTAGEARFYHAQSFGSYSQIDYKPVDWLKLVAGVQMNKPDGIKKDFSPRLAAIVNFNEHWGAKLMYGQAFRPGYAVETAIDLPGIIIGNYSLEPEKIATTEAQVYYHSNMFDGSVTAYHSETSDNIGRVAAVGGGSTVDNLCKTSFQGIELEGKRRMGNGWQVQGSATYQTNETDHGEEDATFTPNLMAKLGVSYESQRGYTLGIFDNYFGAPTPVREVNPNVLENNPDPDSYHLVTANMVFDLPKLLDKKNLPPITASLYIDNVLDEDIYYPEYNRKNINSFPIHSGRAFYGKIQISF
jgi:outer membrane receptor for ferrienterochelin and colicins